MRRVRNRSSCKKKNSMLHTRRWLGTEYPRYKVWRKLTPGQNGTAGADSACKPMSVSSFLRALPRAFGMSEASGDSPDAIASSSAPPDHPEDPRPSPKPAPKQSPAKKRAAASAGGSVAAAATPPAGPPPPPQREAEGLKLCLSPTSNTGYTGVCMRLDKTKAGKLLYIRPQNTWHICGADCADVCSDVSAQSTPPHRRRARQEVLLRSGVFIPSQGQAQRGDAWTVRDGAGGGAGVCAAQAQGGSIH